MATLTSQDSTAQARVYFQTPPGTEDTEVVQKQGRVTVKYDRKELRKRLNLEEWIIEQLTDLYDCEVSNDTFYDSLCTPCFVVVQHSMISTLIGVYVCYRIAVILKPRAIQ